MTEFIVHIGDMKCGSTAIQHSLSASAGGLRELGLPYEAGPNAVNHTPLGILAGNSTRGNLELQRKIGEQQVSLLTNMAQKHDYLIISDEGLLKLDPNLLLPYLEDISVGPVSVSIVAYMRDPADMYLSVVQQVLKKEAAFQPPNEFVRPLDQMLSRWANLSVVKEMRVRSFDRSKLVGGDIVSDFASILSEMVQRPIILPSKTANVSLSVEQMLILHRFWLQSKAEGDALKYRGSMLVNWFAAMNSLYFSGSKPRLHEDVKSVISYANRDVVAELLKAYPNLSMRLHSGDFPVNTYANASLDQLCTEFSACVERDFTSLIPDFSPDLKHTLSFEANEALARLLSDEPNKLGAQIKYTKDFLSKLGCSKASEILISQDQIKALIRRKYAA